MTIRKIVLIPSLLLLGSVAYLAFRPYTHTTAPTSVPVARTAHEASATNRQGAMASTTSARENAAVPSAATQAVSKTAPLAANATTATNAPTPVDVARVLNETGPVPALTSMGPVPAEGSGLYGAPDRLSARRISGNRAASTATTASTATAASTDNRDHDVKSGDAIRIAYRMYELMSGREVESSPPEGILVRVGTGIDDSAAGAVNRVPRGVAESLGHARIGDVVEVILPKDTKDLPPDLDQTSAHKIHITLLGRY